MIKYRLQLVREEDLNYALVVNKISNPMDIVTLLEDLGLGAEAEEVFMILCLNTKNKVVGVFEVSRGTISSSMVHPREVFKRALLCNATSIILAHNHPSGDPTPSREDIEMTKRLAEAGELLGVKVLDHIIIGDVLEKRYASLKEYGAF